MTITRPMAPGDLSAGVARFVREQIACGALTPGDCLLSERVLSERLKVSRGTVRRGLECLVRDNLLKRESGKGYSLCSPDTVPNGGNGHGAVLFVHYLPEARMTANQRQALIWTGARKEAARFGLLTLISSIPESELTPAKAAELAKVAGGVLCDHMRPTSASALLGAGVPVVQIDTYRHPDMPLDAIVQDDLGGIGLAVRHLFERGHRRIGYLDTTWMYRCSGRDGNAIMRRTGFRLACDTLGSRMEGFMESAEAIPAAIAALLARGITALVIPHAFIWAEARAELRGHGIAIPGNFGIVLWGRELAADVEDASPTHITWDKEQMGREGVRRLQLRMSRPNIAPATIVIPTTLVEGSTRGRGPEFDGIEFKHDDQENNPSESHRGGLWEHEKT